MSNIESGADKRALLFFLTFKFLCTHNEHFFSNKCCINLCCVCFKRKIKNYFICEKTLNLYVSCWIPHTQLFCMHSLKFSTSNVSLEILFLEFADGFYSELLTVNICEALGATSALFISVINWKVFSVVCIFIFKIPHSTRCVIENTLCLLRNLCTWKSTFVFFFLKFIEF